MLLKPYKHSAFLFRSHQVASGIDGTEKHRRLEKLLEENYVYQIFPVLYMKKPPWSMTLFLQRMLYWSMFKLLKVNTTFLAIKGGEVVKCSLFEGNHDLDDCNSFLQFDLRERSKWLFHNKLCYGCLSSISVNHNTMVLWY